jgi:hypothetical protein
MGSRPKHKPKNFFTRAEVAQLFEVAPNTVNRWVLAGRLPSVVTPGGRRRYPVGAILTMFDDQMQGANAAGPEEPPSNDDPGQSAPDRADGRAAAARQRLPNRARRK